MRVVVIGAGPAGLYCGYRLRRRWPEAEVRVIEQNASGATFGFGVVFSDQALEFLADDDPETLAAITPLLERWDDITLVHRGERIAIDGIGFAAVGRLALLSVLEARLAAVGVGVVHGKRIDSLREVGDADLVVAADGVNSIARTELAGALGAKVSQLSNRFAWFGTPCRFETLTQTFRRTALGAFNAHHYRYAPDMSTFIVECDAETYARVGFDQMPEAEQHAVCERVFAEDLAGHPLVSNRSIWRRFPVVSCARWSAGNVVVIGDAAQTAHFSIGSGTRLALESVIALDTALAERPGDVPAALADYEARRRPAVEKLVAAAAASAAWYEDFSAHMALSPWDFAMSYLMRSGRLDPARLAATSPRFAAAYDTARERSPVRAGARSGR
jgi:2-polyprenyl-6-methoxyphenol hydroxylase-like FAD-dependent oxidoreductase